MSDFGLWIRGLWVYQLLQDLLGWITWRRRKYGSPSPRQVKLACLIRNGFQSATWVETGTYLGQSTRALAAFGNPVFTLEPQPALFEYARRRLARYANIKVIFGTSETALPAILPDISGDVNFWLDGHSSGGVTYEGQLVSPILVELACISKHRSNFGRVCILVDDVREFGRSSGYPSLDAIVEWAQTNRFRWHIEHDIFVATSDAV
jgi:hypothetical protein